MGLDHQIRACEHFLVKYRIGNRSAGMTMIAWLLLGCLGCGNGTDDSAANARYARQDRQYQRQLDKTDEQMKRTDAAYDAIDAQNERFDKQLDRWGKQSDRYDKILDQWESQTAPSN